MPSKRAKANHAILVSFRYKRLREKVLARDGYRCVYCGNEDDLQVDHIFPRKLGGGHDMENLQTLCKPCNLRKAAKTSFFSNGMSTPPASPNKISPKNNIKRVLNDFAEVPDQK